MLVPALWSEAGRKARVSGRGRQVSLPDPAVVCLVSQTLASLTPPRCTAHACASVHTHVFTRTDVHFPVLCVHLCMCRGRRCRCANLSLWALGTQAARRILKTSLLFSLPGLRWKATPAEPVTVFTPHGRLGPHLRTQPLPGTWCLQLVLKCDL